LFPPCSRNMSFLFMQLNQPDAVAVQLVHLLLIPIVGFKACGTDTRRLGRNGRAGSR
jgi:hypothetical protein